MRQARPGTDYGYEPAARTRRRKRARSDRSYRDVEGTRGERVDSVVDPAVGLVFEKKVGDPLRTGERICAVYSNDRARVPATVQMIRAAIVISPEPVSAPPLVLGEAWREGSGHLKH